MLRSRLIMALLLALLVSTVFPSAAQDALPLTEDFLSADELVMFSYPAEWHIDALDDSSLSLNVSIGTTRQVLDKDIMNKGGDRLAPGEVRVNLATITRSGIAQLVKLPANAPITDILKAELSFMTESKTVFEAVTSVQAAGYDAARVNFTAADRGEGFIILIDHGANLVSGIAAFTAPGELAQWEATLLSIADSVVYANAPKAEATPDLLNTFTSDDKRVAFYYPADWDIKVLNGAFDALGLSVGTAADDLVKDPVARDNDTFEPGQLRFRVFSGERTALLENAKLTVDANVFDLLTVYLLQLTRTNGRFSAAEAVMVGTYPAARADFTVPGRTDGFVMLIDMQDIIVGVTIFYAPDEFPLWETTLQGILDSLTYTPDVQLTPTAP